MPDVEMADAATNAEPTDSGDPTARSTRVGLQTALIVFGIVWVGGIFSARAYAWPILVCAGPFWGCFLIHLGVRTRTARAHLWPLVRFAWCFSVPYSIIVATVGWTNDDYRPSLAIAVPLVATAGILALARWRAVFSVGGDHGVHPMRELLVELFWRFGRWALVVPLVLAIAPATLLNQATLTTELTYPVGEFRVLGKALIVPSLTAPILGYSLRRDGDRRGTVSLILGWLGIVIALHAGLMLIIGGPDLSTLSSILWEAVLVGFFLKVFRERGAIGLDASVAGPDTF